MALSDSAEIMETVAKERFLRKSPFLEFCDAEGLPVITGYGVEDLRKIPLSHWERLGGMPQKTRTNVDICGPLNVQPTWPMAGPGSVVVCPCSAAARSSRR